MNTCKTCNAATTDSIVHDLCRACLLGKDDNDRPYRWIMYTSQNFPGNISFDLSRHTSLDDAKSAFADYCKAVYNDDSHATLYPYSDEDWSSAEDFRDTGCPFDYPSRIIERGPLGGIRVQNT